VNRSYIVGFAVAVGLVWPGFAWPQDYPAKAIKWSDVAKRSGTRLD
jgi:hypothetical protein